MTYLNVTKSSEDLHVFILDDKALNVSYDVLEMQIESRLRSDTEYWLVDISSYGSLKSASKEMQSLALDLDDDVFWYLIDPGMIKIDLWEAYRIHTSRPTTIVSYGNWTMSGGMMTETTDKWVRRSDLMVNESSLQ